MGKKKNKKNKKNKAIDNAKEVSIFEEMATETEKQTEEKPAEANKELLSIVERIENLESEKADLAVDIRDVYAEAKSAGFDVKVLRQVISLRKKTDADREQEESILATYLHAMGMDIN